MNESSRFDLSGTVAVVTGASRGIGLAIARAMLEHGAAVVVGGYDPAETEAAAGQLEGAMGGEARVVPCACDVSQPESAQHLVDCALDHFRRLDTVVCNAGIDIIKPAVDYTPEEWDRILGVNLRGAFLVAQAAARAWIARGDGGSITVTSSVAGRAGIAGLAPYGSSKGGVDQMIRNLAVEWAEHGIRVNGVAPGYVQHVMAGVTVHDDPQMEERIRRFTPMGRRATVDEIAAPFVFLASRAASYVTGAILPVDGGYTAQ
ncbi:MAG TPA: SDR family NAD(P)-dependent oxidoreductase [Longimicrobium sp.]|nr:SDR family NAD(P)-dependent oxidoreductase [Longimicrobium sp.]